MTSLDEVLPQVSIIGGLEIRELDFEGWAINAGGTWKILSQRQALSFLRGYLCGFEAGQQRKSAELREGPDTTGTGHRYPLGLPCKFK